MSKNDMLIQTYKTLIDLCDKELETASGMLECHVMTKRECYVKFVEELEAELT